jgi:hypothetical protein
MLRTLRRHPLLLAAVSTALAGVVLSGNAQAIDPSRDAKDDPHAYVAPHAGLPDGGGGTRPIVAVAALD